MRQIIFDTETTGFNPAEGHRVVEIGAIEMENGSITGRSFHVYINPQRDMPEGAFKVHGLSEEFLSDKPVFKDPSIGLAFLDFVGDGELVAHNADFDMRFMQFELEKAGLAKLTNKVTDTLQIARKKFPGSPASLDALCGRFGISIAEREKQGHGALLDSRLLAEVFIELTGGVQGGLDLAMASNGVGADGKAAPTLQRPTPLAYTPCAQEKAAWDGFIDEMETPLWRSMR